MYGLSCEEYEQLKVRAGDRCEICGNGAGLQIEHDHRILGITAVRGLLCGTCNGLLRRTDSESTRSPLADRYEENAWFRGRRHVLSPQRAGRLRETHPERYIEVRQDAIAQAMCLQFELAPSKPQDWPLRDRLRRFVDAFNETCDGAVSLPDRSRFLHYLREKATYALEDPAVGSLQAALSKWSRRADALRALTLKVPCGYCGAVNAPCVAGKHRKPMDGYHQGRRLRAESLYDRTPEPAL